MSEMRKWVLEIIEISFWRDWNLALGSYKQFHSLWKMTPELFE